jgi:nucleotide-binding universal stress UspA family protein
MYRSLLVPLDSSHFGEQALPLALTIARRANASLEVAHVHVALGPLYAETGLTYDTLFDTSLREAEQNYLNRVAKHLAEKTTTPVTSSLLEGAVAEALHERAVQAGVDLIVLTTHGRGALARAWLGSVPDELVRRGPTPVLVVRPQESKINWNQEPALHRILIPLDGSPLAEQIIEPAVALGTLVGAEYELLRIVRPVAMGPTLAGADLDSVLLARLQELLKEEQRQAEAYLQGVAGRLRERDLVVRTHVVVHDHPAVAILEEIKAQQADLVAIETHGRSGLQRLFLGSVADKVLRGSPVPVLVHRPPRT